MAIEMAVAVVDGNGDSDCEGMDQWMSESSCRRVFFPSYRRWVGNRVLGRMRCELTLGAFTKDARDDVREAAIRGATAHTNTHGRTMRRYLLWTPLCASNRSGCITAPIIFYYLHFQNIRRFGRLHQPTKTSYILEWRQYLQLDFVPKIVHSRKDKIDKEIYNLCNYYGQRQASIG